MAFLMRAFANRVNRLVHLSQYSIPFNRTFFHLRPSPTPASGLITTSLSNDFPRSSNSLLLSPQIPLVSQVCGFKVRFKLKKRCKDCYIVVRQERAYILCPTHPRHKQMSLIKKPKYTWTIVHASQSPVRAW